MEEIKVGEYIKTVAGHIGKIISFNDGMYTAQMKDATIDLYIDDIKNHKENIIDLIEKGDYVNDKLIHKVDIRENSAYIYYGNGKTFCDYQIKDVVTKEQFNQMKYIVGD